jgi:hypothetical protein
MLEENESVTFDLSVLTHKTKSLVFNSTGRLFPVTFMIDNQLIEKVKHYRYLGVMINASGSFSDAKDELYKRGYKMSYELFLLLGHYIILKNNYLLCLIISGEQMYPTLHYHMLK